MIQHQLAWDFRTITLTHPTSIRLVGQIRSGRFTYLEAELVPPRVWRGEAMVSWRAEATPTCRGSKSTLGSEPKSG